MKVGTNDRLDEWKMNIVRMLRRRGMSYLIKAAIVICSVIFLINLTNSYPKGSPLVLQQKQNEAVVVSNLEVLRNDVDERFKDPVNKTSPLPPPQQQNIAQKEIVLETEGGKEKEKNPSLEPRRVTPILKPRQRQDETLHKSPFDLNAQKDGQTQVGGQQFAQPNQNELATKPSRKDAFYENVIVHFDLKGAPPRVNYFVDLLKLVAASGATGILLEWEDMFPWTGSLEPFKSTDAYTTTDVKLILDTAKSLGLTIIPLVQTFGHLEWILKYEEMRKFRENDAYPQVICLGDDSAIEYVREALRQVIEMHRDYGLPFFHIGADEAFEFGVCKKSLEWIRKNGANGGKQMLALSHLKSMAQFVQQLAGPQTTVLAWHDMLKDFNGHLIKQIQLNQFIEPVVWDYSENIVTMPDYSFSLLAENFKTIWASSAFKGANFPGAKYIDIRHYETNNRAWISTKRSQESKFGKFHGIIITGWQRYDHMASLCEILPIGTPSMVLQIQIALHAPKMDANAYRTAAARVLGCNKFNINELSLIDSRCTFPGFDVYSHFQGAMKSQLSRLEEELETNHHYQGWGSAYSRRHNMTQNWYLSSIMNTVENQLSQVNDAETKLRKYMKTYFFENTIDEFIFLTSGRYSNKLRALKADLQRLNTLRAFPKRHFPIARELTEL